MRKKINQKKKIIKINKKKIKNLYLEKTYFKNLNKNLKCEKYIMLTK
jgi:hypothetical protein